MANINIKFKNKSYTIDKSLLEEAISWLDETLERMRYIIIPAIPGLYEKGTYYKKLLIDWDTLLRDGIVHVTDGVVTTNYNDYSNSSSDVLDGDLALPEGIVEIGAEAFAHCKKLNICSIPASTRVVGASAFWYSSLQRIAFAENSTLETLSHGSFSVCNIEYIELPDSLTSIGSSAFAPSLIKEITIPIGITTLKQHLFQYCSHLEKIHYKGTVA
jgi:hypothetical protein